MIRTNQQILSGALLLLASSLVQAAPIYTYTDPDPNQNPAGGKLSAVTTTYDANTETFSWAYTVEDPAGQDPHNGFWLVVNDGPKNPKGEDGNLAILYGDLVTQSITAYVYNGNNNPGSFLPRTNPNIPATFLGSFQNAIDITAYADPINNTGSRTVSFSLDVSGINSGLDAAGDPIRPAPEQKPWDGVHFDDQLGIWFHSTTGVVGPATYDKATGEILSFNTNSTGWIDTGLLHTRVVPEPGIVYLAGMGLVALGMSRRRGFKIRVA